MGKKVYKNKKVVLIIGAVFLISGAILAYYKWGIEPEETISGILCGLGLSLTILSFGIK